MARANINGLNLEYETFGNPAAPAMLLIMGLGCQLIQWPLSLCQQLAEHGHFVIRYDHRDIGLSTQLDHLKLPNIPWTLIRQRLGLRPKIPYRLEDLAADALGLLDYLQIQQAHLVGVSMGGMIAQLIAIRHPGRVLTLTSIMSTTGNPRLPGATREAQAALAAPLKRSRKNRGKDKPELEEVIEQTLHSWKAIRSPGFPLDEQVLRTQCEAVIVRGHHPAGIARHLLACLCAPDRRPRLRQLSLPTLVIHGTHDPLVPLACGEDTAANIPGAELYTIEGMGHDLPALVVPQLVERISAQTRRAGAATTPRPQPAAAEPLVLDPGARPS